MPVRKAGDRIRAAFTPEGNVSQETQQALDTISDVSGKTSQVVMNPELRGTGTGGYVRFDTPEEVVLNPDTSAFVAAHEGMHSQMQTKLGQKEINNYLNYGSGYAPTDMNPMDVPRESGNGLRYRQEMEVTPVMLEEASAQGGATGVMQKMGLKNQDTGFATQYAEGNLQYEGDVVRNSDGSVDSLAYPLMYRDKVVNEYTNKYGSQFEGKPLGIGIDPRFSDKERDVYYRIGEDSRQRAKRQFDKSKAMFTD